MCQDYSCGGGVTMYQDYSCGGLQCIRIIVLGGYNVSGL